MQLIVIICPTIQLISTEFVLSFCEADALVPQRVEFRQPAGNQRQPDPVAGLSAANSTSLRGQRSDAHRGNAPPAGNCAVAEWPFRGRHGTGESAWLASGRPGSQFGIHARVVVMGGAQADETARFAVKPIKRPAARQVLRPRVKAPGQRAWRLAVYPARSPVQPLLGCNCCRPLGVRLRRKVWQPPS